MKRGPRVIKACFVPRGFCVNLFGTVWVRDPSWISAEILRHERIHTAQMRELLFVPFYIVYFLEWLFHLVRLRRGSYAAYMAISFEREAYANSHNPGYLSRRRHFAQWRGRKEC